MYIYIYIYIFIHKYTHLHKCTHTQIYTWLQITGFLNIRSKHFPFSLDVSYISSNPVYMLLKYFLKFLTFQIATKQL